MSKANDDNKYAELLFLSALDLVQLICIFIESATEGGGEGKYRDTHVRTHEIHTHTHTTAATCCPHQLLISS